MWSCRSASGQKDNTDGFAFEQTPYNVDRCERVVLEQYYQMECGNNPEFAVKRKRLQIPILLTIVRLARHQIEY